MTKPSVEALSHRIAGSPSPAITSITRSHEHAAAKEVRGPMRQSPQPIGNECEAKALLP